MPDWIIVSLILLVSLAAFLGAVVGVFIARRIIRAAAARDSKRGRRETPPTEAEQVLDMARDLRGLVNAALLEHDLRGGPCA
jgi:uncharacterized protein YneF (UPF0154 family)